MQEVEIEEWTTSADGEKEGILPESVERGFGSLEWGFGRGFEVLYML